MSHNSPEKIPVVICNIGSPERPDLGSVRRYLRRFLMDKKVIDLPFVGRWLLVNLIIAPFRSPKSLEAYKQIWGKGRAPLVEITDKFIATFNKAHPRYELIAGMQYSAPFTIDVVRDLLVAGKRFWVVPMYPQYAAATWASAIDEIGRAGAKTWDNIGFGVIAPFYKDPGYIDPLADKIRTALSDSDIDAVLMSYHGLPARQIVKSQPACAESCLKSPQQPCEALMEPSEKTSRCYRRQCFLTTEAVKEKLGDAIDGVQVVSSFQSRLGKQEWIKPYTDKVLEELYKNGVRHLAVACPAFVFDCLETLEEINMGIRENWLNIGPTSEEGKPLKFTFIPCLNVDSAWVDGFANILDKQIPHS